jgi:hypothetical protein
MIQNETRIERKERMRDSVVVALYEFEVGRKPGESISLPDSGAVSYYT